MDVITPKSNTGFTLIELILVIIVVGILAAFAVSKWPGTTINLDAQAEQLASDVRYTQSLAMTKGQRFYLIRVSSTTYQIRDSSGTAIPLARGNTTVTLGSGITFGTLSNLPNNLVAFDGQGVPYTDTGSPGTALAATASMALVSGGQTETVRISPETGRVTTS